ncbi:hypothetical protein OG939_32190 [Streptomyces sp. NBC_01685]|uniref:hypothetical protein n=1 Tax=Streptomyces sp. NBC_01685 TaxID=2975910 RepID=UPI002E370001|nr:hypothetical protein [Streptomyces sp. NBC_01685]
MPITSGPDPGGGPCPAGEQRIVAADGFAYGAMHADIHVFGDGAPAYRLGTWPSGRAPLPRTDVPAAALERLREWRDSGPALSGRWLHGPDDGRRGVLAARFAAESAGAGWEVLTASLGSGPSPVAAVAPEIRAGGPVGVLLIVDHIDRWPHSHVTWLFSNALLERADAPVRMLLLSSGLDAWPAIRASLAGRRAAHSAQALPRRDDDSGR